MAEGAVEKSVRDLEDEITCAICHEHYKDPKVLSCCHYYCKQCIYSLALRTGLDKPLSCPECRKDTTLPQGGVDNLQAAFFINPMKEVHSKLERATGKVEVKCEMCSGAKAEAFCRQCTMFICAECVKQHQKMKVFAGHKTSFLEELKEGGAKEVVTQEPALTMCKLHKEPMKIFCFGCSCLICRDCYMKDHFGHNYEFITVAGPEMKKKLTQHLEPLRETKVNLSCAVKKILTTKSEVKVQGHSVTTRIESLFDELYQIMKCRKQELLAEAAKKEACKLERLSSQEKSLSTTCAMVESVIEYAEQCIEHSADDEIMCIHAELLSRIDREIEEQQKEGKNLEPVEEADMTVEVNCVEELKQLCQTKVKICSLHSDASKSRTYMSGKPVISRLSNIPPTKAVPVETPPINAMSVLDKTKPVDAKGGKASPGCAKVRMGCDGHIIYDRDFLMQLKDMPTCHEMSVELLGDLVLLDIYRDGLGGKASPGCAKVRMGCDGRIIYDRDFLMQLKDMPTCHEMSVELLGDLVLLDIYRDGLAQPYLKTEQLYRKFQDILNKLTVQQKFQPLAEQALNLDILTEDRLSGCIDMIFTKVLNEPNFTVVCAKLCKVMSPIEVEVDVWEGKTNFRRVLLTKCQYRFEKGKQIVKTLKEEYTQAESEEEQQKLKEELSIMRKRSLNNVRFIGELFKLKMLSETIMHECVTTLLKSTSDEDSLECFGKLIMAIGKDLDRPEAKVRMDAYFKHISNIIKKGKIPDRIKFLLDDVQELRKYDWNQAALF